MQQQSAIAFVILITLILIFTVQKRISSNNKTIIPQVYDKTNLVKFTYVDPLTKRIGREFEFNDTSNDFRYLAHARLRTNSHKFPQPVTAISSNHVHELCMNLRPLYTMIPEMPDTIVYNIGLTSDDKAHLKDCMARFQQTMDRIKFREFDFGEFQGSIP